MKEATRSTAKKSTKKTTLKPTTNLKVGMVVTFTTSPRSKAHPSKKLTGELLRVYWSRRMGKDAVKIKTDLGIFFKVASAVTPV